MSHDLTYYRLFARLRWPRTYLGKFLLTAFLGVHVPLIGLAIFVSASLLEWSTAAPFLIATTIATLLGTIVTQIVQGKLLAPVLRTAQALEEYRTKRTIPDLPATHTDEAGLLMANTENCIRHLDELLSMKNNLLAVLSHDARTPLANIVIACSRSREILTRDDIDIRELRYLNNKIREAVDSQAALMSSILMIARADSGAITPIWSEAMPAELLMAAAESIRIQAQAKGVTISIGDIDGLEEPVIFDVDKTQQVINNLAINAVKFTPAGGEVVLGGALREDSIELTVHDTGIGMDSDIISRLFTPFTGAHRVGTAAEPGSGLGLWICKTFTELQGGSIAVRSMPGNGSSFTVNLPRRTDTRMRNEIQEQLAMP